jgi:hypothetical protein
LDSASSRCPACAGVVKKPLNPKANRPLTPRAGGESFVRVFKSQGAMPDLRAVCALLYTRVYAGAGRPAGGGLRTGGSPAPERFAACFVWLVCGCICGFREGTELEFDFLWNSRKRGGGAVWREDNGESGFFNRRFPGKTLCGICLSVSRSARSRRR